MKKFILSAVFIFIAVTIINAQDAGKTGLAFLKYDYGARNAALGETGVISANGVTSLNYNPALLADYNGAQLFLSHNELITDVRSELFGSYFKLLGLPFAVGLNTTSVSDIEVRYKPGEALSTFNAHYFWGSLSTGFYLMDNLSFGVTGKYLYEGMLTHRSNGTAWDFGLRYAMPENNIYVGAALKNIGSMDELNTAATELPSELKLGVMYKHNFENMETEVMAAAAYNRYLESEVDHPGVGLEAVYKKFVSLRLGYVTGYESRSVSAGFGVLWNGFNVDYAYTPYDYDLGNSHSISLTYNF